MSVQKLDRSQWEAFLNHVSKGLIGKRAEIEVASIELGHQIEAKWLPVIGIVYDPKNDLIEIALENLDHMVRKPRELYVDVGPAGLASLDVIDSDGVLQHVEFRDPLMLPPRQAAPQAGAEGRPSGKL
jgi:hypothetical protein